MKDFYYILNVDANATLKEIKEAYDNLSKKFRPFLDQQDKFVEEQFREISDAYQVLSDPVCRQNHDQELKEIKFNPIKKASKVQRVFFKTRTLDIMFTVTLGVFTFLFGYYVINSFRSFKVAKAKKSPVVGTISQHKTIQHKFKHHKKISATNSFSKTPVDDTTAILASQQASVIQPQIQTPVTQPQIYTDKNSMGSSTAADVISSEAKPVSIILNTEKHPIKEADLPYTTYLRANETGVINMRKFDNYGSEIIKVIPTNSEVSVLEKGNSYYKVLFENTTGYVAKWNVLKK